VICRSWESLVLWLLGYPDQALHMSQAAYTLAQEMAHPYSQGYALMWAAMLHTYRREGQLVQARTEALMTLSTAQEYALYMGAGTFWQGLIQTQEAYRSGRPEQGEVYIARMRQGLTDWLATGAGVFQPYFLALLGEAYGNAGHTEQGLAMLTEASAVVERTGERYYEAEIQRLRGELLLRQTPPEVHQAETCLQHALAVAQRQQAKSLELRAAMSLSRLWQQQEKRDKARRLLAEVYNWFTEGFDTADLQEARALLDELV
jgi:predicted ATPase